MALVSPHLRLETAHVTSYTGGVTIAQSNLQQYSLTAKTIPVLQAITLMINSMLTLVLWITLRDVFATDDAKTIEQRLINPLTIGASSSGSL